MQRTIIFAAIIIIFSASLSYSQQLDIEGNLSLWYDIYEENENQVRQATTGILAADTTSGFNLKQGRVAFNYKNPDTKLDGRIQIRLEERVAVLDAYAKWHPHELINIYAGQMKIPSLYEALISDSELDFISRSTLSGYITDWSLSRTPYYSAFYGNRSYSRDLGIGLKGKAGPDKNKQMFSYFLMVGNGLGANLFIGGPESKEFLYSNSFGDYFYGGRINITPISWMGIGGHYSRNTHNNVLFNDGKTVFDLERQSWSADFHTNISRFQAGFMYGEGKVKDDYFYSTETSLYYQGYEVRILCWLVKELLQAGARYDTYTFRLHENGISTHQRNTTFGINVIPMKNMRLQLNYMIKETEEAGFPDLGDNILYLNFQYNFDVAILQ
ncbi:hypothetical protein GF312_20070 [Candidatus Poribacteria bacterium]|nr:hypothetical protein [Candidatus Poribacteria bacterium]